MGKGDVAIIGVNANDGPCGAGGGGVDEISMVFFKNFERGSKLVITDNGYIASNDTWRNEERYLVLQYIDRNIIPKGTVLYFRFSANDGTIEVYPKKYSRWKTLLKLGNNPFDLNQGGDQIFVLSEDGKWEKLDTDDSHAKFKDGEVLYAFNTTDAWLPPVHPNEESKNSNLPPQVDSCNIMKPTTGNSDFLLFNPDDQNLLTRTTKLGWIKRIGNSKNWKSYKSCTTYNAANTITKLEIKDFTANIQASPNSVCSGQKPILQFTFSDTTSVFNVVYTDGTNTFTASNISSGSSITHENVINGDTTFSIVSVSGIDACPVSLDETVSVKVSVKSNVVIELQDKQVCQNDNFSLPIFESITGIWNTTDVSTKNVGTRVYKFTPSTNQCVTGNLNFTLTIKPKPITSPITNL